MVGYLLCETKYVRKGFILFGKSEPDSAKGSEVEIDGGQLPEKNSKLPKSAQDISGHLLRTS
jgi:hypothetical protein